MVEKWLLLELGLGNCRCVDIFVLVRSWRCELWWGVFLAPSLQSFPVGEQHQHSQEELLSSSGAQSLARIGIHS